MKKFLALALALMMVLALCACGEKAEEPAVEEAPVVEEAPAVEAPAVDAAPAPEGEASGEPSGEMGASGEMGGMGNQSSDFEITVNGVSGTAHYEDVDSGDQATKTFVITWEGKDINGAIDKGVWTATSGDAGDQAVVDAVKTAFEGNNGGSMGPSEEPAA